MTEASSVRDQYGTWHRVISLTLDTHCVGCAVLLAQHSLRECSTMYFDESQRRPKNASLEKSRRNVIFWGWEGTMTSYYCLAL